MHDADKVAYKFHVANVALCCQCQMLAQALQQTEHEASSISLFAYYASRDGWMFDASYVFAHYASRDGWMFDASYVYLHSMLVGMDGYLTQVMFLHIMLVGMDGYLMQFMFLHIMLIGMFDASSICFCKLCC